jgi:hypothetical protein
VTVVPAAKEQPYINVTTQKDRPDRYAFAIAVECQ